MDEFYILDIRKHWHGYLAIWWGPKSTGYYSELGAAGIYTKAEADRICGKRGEQIALPVEEVRAVATLVVDTEKAIALAKR